MKKSSKVLVPFTAAEWHFVKTNFMSNDVDLLEQIFEMLCMWEGRTGSDTPIFIQMSRLIVQAIIYDLRHCSDDRSNEFNLMSICGLSLTRFINYVNEVAQPKVGFLLSIANAVKEFGIPERIVQLRQNVVHGEMPSIIELREAIGFCRDWLWEMNWKYSMAIAICDPTVSIKPTTSTDEETGPDLEQLFSQIWALNSKKSNDTNEKAAIERKIKAIVDTLTGLMADKLDDILDAFSDALLLTKNAKRSAKTYLQINDVEENQLSWTVSEPLFNAWRPIIDVFSRGRYGVLLSHLSAVVCDELRPKDDRLQIAGWFRYILDEIKSTDTFLSVKDLNATAHNLINAEKFFTIEDFNKCLDLFGDELERKSFYQKMWKLKRSAEVLKQNDENQTAPKPGIFTLENLKSALEKKRGIKRQAVENPTTTNWCLTQLNCPLGLQSDQSPESLFLRI